ncbi:MAG: sodium-dependent transporter [Clostridia bacterium]|nr:sodium-dependent transporter [Clostridia bacterium]
MASKETKPVKTQNNSGFTGKMGYVLAAAASAVGLGNIWRFPYLCAKYGGGIFLAIYLILVLTFGYALLMSETAIGRMTGKSPIGAFKHFSNTKAASFGGWINALVPFIICPYYAVIGGWVIKYLVGYSTGETQAMAADGYFFGYISSNLQPELFFIIFVLLTLVVILGGVQNGVEKVSRIMMPILIALAVVVSIYSCTRPGAVEGIKYMFIPNIHNFSIMTIVSAMGQMFYSLSLAMGIMITYGSYVDRNQDLEDSTTTIELFDTIIAILAGLMIIPAVFAFSGGDPETLNAGPSLMFITIPKVLVSMGFGTPAGIVFFLLVLLAALTRAISLTETCVGTLSDELGWSRKKATLIFGVYSVVLGSLASLGYGALGNLKIIGMQVLDFLDFISNSVMMPVSALAICILVTRSIGLKAMADEFERNSKFRRKPVYNFSMKFLAPVALVIILISSVLSAFGIISI